MVLDLDAGGCRYSAFKASALGPPPAWSAASVGLLNGTKAAGAPAGSSLQVGEYHYCDIWSPVIVPPPPTTGVFQLLFSARRYETAQSPCPPLPFPYNGAIYQGVASVVEGPYTAIVAMGAAPTCTNPRAPRALPTAAEGCGASGECDLVIRLGPALFTEGASFSSSSSSSSSSSGGSGGSRGGSGGSRSGYTDGSGGANNSQHRNTAFLPTVAAQAAPAAPVTPTTTWMAYEWYTHEPPRWESEQADSGEHISIVQMSRSDRTERTVVDCNSPSVMNVTSPKDPWLLQQLEVSASQCVPVRARACRAWIILSRNPFYRESG